MPQYHLSGAATGYDSGYESEGGRKYKPAKQHMGRGEYAIARYLETDTGHAMKVVLSPVRPDDVDEVEACRKYRFFKALYPTEEIYLMRRHHTYRLVLPLIPGIPYDRLRFSNFIPLLEVLVSLVRAVKHAHRLGYVIVDLKRENVLYDEATEKAYLIDGGLSAKTGEALSEDVFVLSSEARVNAFRKHKRHMQIAPECWSTAPVVSHESMDVYSLGVILSEQLPHFFDLKLANLAKACMHSVALMRPNLDHIEVQLMGMLFEQKVAARREAAHTYRSAICDQLEAMFSRAAQDAHCLDEPMKHFIFKLFALCAEDDAAIQQEAQAVLNTVMSYVKSRTVQAAVTSWLMVRLDEVLRELEQRNGCIPWCFMWMNPDAVAPLADHVLLSILPIVYGHLAPADQRLIQTWIDNCPNTQLATVLLSALHDLADVHIANTTIFDAKPLGIADTVYDLIVSGGGYRMQRHLMLRALERLTDSVLIERQKALNILSFLLCHNASLSRPMQTHIELHPSTTIEAHAFEFFLNCHVNFFKRVADDTAVDADEMNTRLPVRSMSVPGV